MTVREFVRHVLAAPRAVNYARNIGLTVLIATVLANGLAARRALDAQEDQVRMLDARVERIARDVARDVLREGETPEQRQARIARSALAAIRFCARDRECRQAGRRAFGLAPRP